MPRLRAGAVGDRFPPLWLTAVRLLGAAVVVAVVLALRGDLRTPPRDDYPSSPRWP